HVADAGRVLLVMRIELLAHAHNALVLRVRLAHLHFHHDGLLHLGRNDLADLLVAARFYCGFALDYFCHDFSEPPSWSSSSSRPSPALPIPPWEPRHAASTRAHARSS